MNIDKIIERQSDILEAVLLQAKTMGLNKEMTKEFYRQVGAEMIQRLLLELPSIAQMKFARKLNIENIFNMDCLEIKQAIDKIASKRKAYKFDANEDVE